MPARTFGIEIEIAQRRPFEQLRDIVDTALDEFPRHARVRVNYDHASNGRTWDVKPDGSCGGEICTPAMTWRRWPHVVAVLRGLRSAGLTANRQCGIHVHHKATHLTDEGLRKLWFLWYNYEPLLFSLVAPSRWNNSFCRRLRLWQRRDPDLYWTTEDARVRNPQDVLTMRNDRFRQMVQGRGRYQALNLTNWWRTGRVEIRAHHGNLNGLHLRFWTRLTQRLVAAPDDFTMTTLRQMEPTDSVSQQLREFGSYLQATESYNWNRAMTRMIERRNPGRLDDATAAAV